MPGGLLGGRVTNGFFVGGHVIAPILAFVNIDRGILPILRRLVEARQKPPLLLLRRNVEKELADDRAVARQVLLEGSDILEPLLPDISSD